MEQASSSSQLPELPDPLPNLPQEIQFRRLLQACQAQVQAQASSSHATAGGDAAGIDLQAAKLKHYIDSLQEQLDELERSHALELGFKALSAYRQHVSALVARTPKVTLPAYCLKPKPPAPPPPVAPPPRAPSSSQPPGPPKTFAFSTVNGNGNGAAQDADRGNFAISEAARKKVEQHAQLHESLTDRLGELVGAVKENALTAQAKVEQRGKLVDVADTALVQNLDKTKAVVMKSKEQYKRGGSTFCLTLGILLLVGLVFTAMLVYIKGTHLIGYRAHKATRLPDEL